MTDTLDINSLAPLNTIIQMEQLTIALAKPIRWLAKNGAGERLNDRHQKIWGALLKKGLDATYGDLRKALAESLKSALLEIDVKRADTCDMRLRLLQDDIRGLLYDAISESWTDGHNAAVDVMQDASPKEE